MLIDLADPLRLTIIFTQKYSIYVTGPAIIDHVNAKKSPIVSVFAVS